MNGSLLKDYLRDLCHEIDEGRPLNRARWRSLFGPLVGSAVLAGALSLGGCFDELSPVVAEYAAPMPGPAVAEVCGDGLDNDRDGLTDCADSDCEAALGCQPAPEYMAPLPDRAAPPSEPTDPGGPVAMYGIYFPPDAAH